MNPEVRNFCKVLQNAFSIIHKQLVVTTSIVQVRYFSIVNGFVDRFMLYNYFNPIRSGLFQTAIDPGGGGFKSPPLRSRKLFCQSSLYHTCAFYQVF